MKWKRSELLLIRVVRVHFHTDFYSLQQIWSIYRQ